MKFETFAIVYLHTNSFVNEKINIKKIATKPIKI